MAAFRWRRVEAVGNRMVATVIEHLLGAANGERRFGGDVPGDLAHAGLQFRRCGEEAVGEP